MTTSWNDLAELEKTNSTPTENNLLLIDSNNVAFRYFHRPNFDDYSSDYIRTINSLGKSYNATRIICCFDVGSSTFRKTMFPGYKQNRKVERSEEEQARFTSFFDCLKYTAEVMPFEQYKFKGIEADDIISYLTTNLKAKYDNVWIVSSDRDLYQLLDTNVHIFNLFSRKEISLDSLLEDHNLTPKEFLYTRMIEGDKSDGILGIEGIGPKRSKALIEEYKNIDKLLNALPLAGRAKYIKNLNAGKDIININKQLMDLKSYINEVLSMGENPDVVLEVLTKAINK